MKLDVSKKDSYHKTPKQKFLLQDPMFSSRCTFFSEVIFSKIDCLKLSRQIISST